MIKIIKYVMRVFYYKENSAKYKMEGGSWNYFVSLMGGSFLILIALVLLIFILFSVFPSLYESFLRTDKLPDSRIIGFILVAIIVLGLKVLVPHNELRKEIIDEREIKKAIIYIVFYIFLSTIIIITLGLKVLREYKENIGM